MNGMCLYYLSILNEEGLRYIALFSLNQYQMQRSSVKSIMSHMLHICVSTIAVHTFQQPRLLFLINRITDNLIVRGDIYIAWSKQHEGDVKVSIPYSGHEKSLMLYNQVLRLLMTITKEMARWTVVS